MRFFPTATGLTPRPVMRSGGASIGAAGSAGKSIAIHDPSRSAVRRPLCVSKRACVPAGRCRSSHRTWADARVAWPHRAISMVGVNQRSCQALPVRTRNAVSERFISRATRCIQPSLAGLGSTHTAAGFPANGVAVNASTCTMRTLMSPPSPRLRLRRGSRLGDPSPLKIVTTWPELARLRRAVPVMRSRRRTVYVARLVFRDRRRVVSLLLAQHHHETQRGDRHPPIPPPRTHAPPPALVDQTPSLLTPSRDQSDQWAVTSPVAG